MNLGSAGTDDGDCRNSNNDALHRAIYNSDAAGVTYVVAAGNDNSNVAGFVPSAFQQLRRHRKSGCEPHDGGTRRVHSFVVEGRRPQHDFRDEHGVSARGRHCRFRDLRGVLERERAAIGVLLTLDEPTPRCARKRPRRDSVCARDVIGPMSCASSKSNSTRLLTFQPRMYAYAQRSLSPSKTTETGPTISPLAPFRFDVTETGARAARSRRSPHSSAAASPFLRHGTARGRRRRRAD
jgi:hypothetical protein